MRKYAGESEELERRKEMIRSAFTTSKFFERYFEEKSDAERVLEETKFYIEGMASWLWITQDTEDKEAEEVLQKLRKAYFVLEGGLSND